MMNEAAAEICKALGLERHPEGGWYRETWRAPDAAGERAGGTAIHFLLAAGERSHWHRVDAAELWFWHAGDPLMLSIDNESGTQSQAVRLGPDIAAGDSLQAIVPAENWQAAESISGPSGYTLVSCVVIPGFEFAGFTLAPPGWTPGNR